MVVILVSVFNFYKAANKRDKEHRQWAEQTRAERQRDLVEQQEATAKVIKQQQAERSAFLTKWLEYDDRCCDLHALIFRPSEYEQLVAGSVQRNVANDTNSNVVARLKAGKEKILFAEDKREVCKEERVEPSEAGLPANEHVQDKVAVDLSLKIVYVAIFVLLVSLGKAAYDWSKQFKEVSCDI